MHGCSLDGTNSKLLQYHITSVIMFAYFRGKCNGTLVKNRRKPIPQTAHYKAPSEAHQISNRRPSFSSVQRGANLRHGLLTAKIHLTGNTRDWE